MIKKCPVCNDKILVSVLTKQGVEVDMCPECEGIWLDRDEIYFFTSMPSRFRSKFKQALEKKWITQRISPVSGERMFEIPMFDGDAHINYCPQSGGIWLDKSEKERLSIGGCKIEIDPVYLDNTQNTVSYTDVFDKIIQNVGIGIITFSLSVVYLFLLFIILCFFTWINQPLYLAFVIFAIFIFLHILLSPILIDIILKVYYHVEWMKTLGLPLHLQEFIDEICRQHHIKSPVIGVIKEGTPLSFVYGHHPGNGRIILTQSLIDTLDEKELEAVVAHEISHMLHWDMLIMTLSQSVPILLFHIHYFFLKNFINRIGLGGYISGILSSLFYGLYGLGKYINLPFFRSREYIADHFAAKLTSSETLISALLKISYGVAGKRSAKYLKDYRRSEGFCVFEILSTTNRKESYILSIYRADVVKRCEEDIDRTVLGDVAKWELWNPWALFYELFLPQPLISKRVDMLNRLSSSINEEPYIVFDKRRPHTFWDDFIVDISLYLLPIIVVILWVVFSLILGIFVGRAYFPRSFYSFASLLLFLGFSILLKTLYSYPSKNFVPVNIRALLKNIRVSAVSPVPCRLKGKISGKRIPGLFRCDYYLFEDNTGILFLDYFNRLSIDTLFSALRGTQYHDVSVEIIGWYRRAPIPYIEVKEINVEGSIRASNSYRYKLIVAFGMIVLGGILFFL